MNLNGTMRWSLGLLLACLKETCRCLSNESNGGGERWAFDLFVAAAPWELAEINALFS